MKKTILISMAGLALFLAGCTQQAPNANQNLNQPAANVNQNTNQPVANVNQDVNINTNQPTDPTANWLTFTNDKFEYTIKYPQKFSVKEWAEILKAGDPKGVNDWLFSEVAFGKNTNPGDWQISINVSSRSLNEEEELVKISVANAWKNQEEVLIDGIKSTKYTGDGGEGITGRIIKILIPYDNKVYSLTYSEANDKNDNLDIYNQMVSTFQFTK